MICRVRILSITPRGHGTNEIAVQPIPDPSLPEDSSFFLDTTNANSFRCNILTSRDDFREPIEVGGEYYLGLARVTGETPVLTPPSSEE